MRRLRWSSRVLTQIGGDDLVVSCDLDRVRQLDPRRVEHHAQAGEDVAPVVVFDTHDGVLLAARTGYGAPRRRVPKRGSQPTRRTAPPLGR